MMDSSGTRSFVSAFCSVIVPVSCIGAIALILSNGCYHSRAILGATEEIEHLPPWGAVAGGEAGDSPPYLIGVGSYDITGPAADVNLMGYAKPDQTAKGIHVRLRSRAFVIAEPGEGGKRVAFVSIDACMASQIVAMKVVERLKKRYGNLYTEKNVAISGTHSHSGPAGYLQYLLYIITSLGFVRQTFDSLVEGIEQSVVIAHESLRPGSIFHNSGELLDANINRSPSSYLRNPESERKRYTHDVDKTMTLLKFVDAQHGNVGAITWFAVHCTSMNNTNELISGDNKGVASRFFEDWAEEQRARDSSKLSNRAPATTNGFRSLGEGDKWPLPGATGGMSAAPEDSVRLRNRRRGRREDRGGQGTMAVTPPPFVAAFAQSNVGDTSPNVLGPFCADTGLPCDFNTSTCAGKNEMCIGRGPNFPDYFGSTLTIANRQLAKGKELFLSANEKIQGSIDFRQAFVDMSNVSVNLPGLDVGKTCPPAMGFSFAAGTTDGPGAFNFKQGDHQGNVFWRLVGALIHPPSATQSACHAPKPILIDTGETTEPYAWQPRILPIQILRVGQLIILACPGEFTSMAGRRLRETVKRVLMERGREQFGEGTRVVIAGLANAYSSYVATYEEYQAQRYEAASTIYGPHTLSAYIQEFSRLAAAMAEGNDVPPGPSPPDLLSRQLSFLPPVVADGVPPGAHFGDVIADVACKGGPCKGPPEFRAGDVAEATFRTGCPRNDVFAERTFTLVERRRDGTNDDWEPMYDDDDWSVRFYWDRPSPLSVESMARVWWQIPKEAPPGVYRLRHFGAHKHFLGKILHFTGASRAFYVR